jgi:hypothetical protein
LFLCLGLDLLFSRHLRPSFLFLAPGRLFLTYPWMAEE